VNGGHQPAAPAAVGEPGRPTYVPPVLAGIVGYLLRLAHERAYAGAAAVLPPDQHPRDYPVLAAIDVDRAGQSQQQLADLLSVNRTIMVKMIDRLARAGLVARRRNPADRRSYLLRLTDAGRSRLAAMDRDLEAADRLFTAGLTAQETERLRDLLSRILFTRDHLSRLPAMVTRRTGFFAFHAHARAQAVAARLLAPLGITPRHVGSLAVIEDGAPCSQQYVASELGVSGAVMVEIVDELEDRGLVERRPSRTDRRRYELSLTAAGKTVLARAWELASEATAQLTADLDAPAADELPALLRKLLAHPVPTPAQPPGDPVGAPPRPGRTATPA
jgi:DNA-binding MarR family transcriptional regulator